jgi:hypothetical protein
MLSLRPLPGLLFLTAALTLTAAPRAEAQTEPVPPVDAPVEEETAPKNGQAGEAPSDDDDDAANETEETDPGEQGPESGAETSPTAETSPSANPGADAVAPPPVAPVGGTPAPGTPPGGDPPPADGAPPADNDQTLPFDKERARTPTGTVRPVDDNEPETPDEDAKKRATERQDFSINALRLSAAGGYALRLSADERSHGGAATLSVGLPIFAGFGVAGEALLLGWGPSEKRAAPLGFAGGAGLLTYVFDDSASTALIGVGPLVGYALELEEDGSFTTGLHAGAMFSFGLRFAVAPTVAAEIGIRAPFILYGPEGFVFRIPLTQSTTTTPGLFESQFVLTLGLTFDPFMFFDLFSKGADPLPLVVPFMAAASDDS